MRNVFVSDNERRQEINFEHECLGTFEMRSPSPVRSRALLYMLRISESSAVLSTARISAVNSERSSTPSPLSSYLHVALGSYIAG